MSTSSSSPLRLALDLDGTLVDPKPRQLAVLAAVLEEDSEAGPVDGERLWELKREGLTTAGALARLGLAEDRAAALAGRWAEAVEDPSWLRLDDLLPGVERELETLAGRGFSPAILTARAHPDRVRGQIESLGLARWCGEVRVVDPRRAAELKATELRSLGSEGFVGDAESDAEAAALAGVPFAAVAGGQRSARFLRERGLVPHASLGEALRALGIGR